MTKDDGANIFHPGIQNPSFQETPNVELPKMNSDNLDEGTDFNSWLEE